MLFISNLIQNNSIYLVITILSLILVLLIWNIIIQIKISRLKNKYNLIFSGGRINNLEELLLDQAKNFKLLDKDIQELFNISNQINSLALRGLHKVGIVRFNPFKDVGGDQSFSIALLNGKNNGLVISSLFTREGARVYSKSIENGKSEKHPLSQEEEKAIKMALQPEIKK